MNKRLRLLVSWFFCVLFLAPLFSMAQEVSTESTFCKFAGWLVRPIGLCVQNEVLDTTIVYEQESTVTLSEENVVTPPPVIIEYSTTTQPVYNDIKNEYVTIRQTGVSESLLNSRVTELLLYIDSLPRGVSAEGYATAGSVDSSGQYVTREFLEKSIDKVYDQLSDIDAGDASDFDFTNTVLFGDTFVSGRLGVGTATPLDVLSVAGAVYLSATTPADTTNRLYNSGSALYWDGSILSGAGATTSPWSEVSGNAIRATGNVGIGTTTPGDTLTVAGSIGADSVTAELIDEGGVVCNVEAYGAVGDNSTLNDAAIARAIAACPDGGTVFFPMGEFRIANTIVLDKPVTLRGSYSPRWSYSSAPRSSIRADFGSFSGVALVHVRDRSISGETEHNNGGRIEHLSLDGGSAGAGVEGIYFEGLVRDWKLTDVDISQVTGNGFEAAVGAGSGNPRGFTIRGLSIYSADGHGFRATALNDSYIDDLLAVGNSLRGIYLSSMGETKVANSRAVFNGLTGLYIDGATANGGMSFTDFSTDRNDRHGVRISATGTSTIIFNGLLTRRDGPNTSGGTETPYAGVAIIGSPTEKVAPVFISGLGQTVGVDDSGVPPLSPSTGVRVTNAEYVKIDGQLWGVDESWRDDGGNDFFIIEDDAILKTGTAGAQELFTNERKWQSTSTDQLIFGNTVSIGSSTDNRLLNIVAPNNAGARFKDTTNDVTFDMRAEDFQAFFGTFSNHQLRFQTNNTSRLTIDTNGRIGIGTTTPVTNLSVVGDAYFTGALRDSLNNVGTNGFVLQTTGAGTQWVATSTLGYKESPFTTSWPNTYLTEPTLRLNIGAASPGFGTPTLNLESAVSGMDDTLLLRNNSGGDGRGSSVVFANNTGLLGQIGVVRGVSSGFSTMKFYTGSSGTLSEVMRMDEGRQVMIGTSSALARLTVQGEGSVDILNLVQAGGDSAFIVTDTGSVGIGTSSPSARLSIENTGMSGAGVVGIDQYLGTANSVASAVQYGNRSYLNAANTATTTIVGNMYRLADNTTFGNTVRGLEVQTNRGSNTLGENTALSGFARTFGVRGVTSGDAGGSFEPAGGFFETEGTTQGNAIRGYSDSITSATLLSLFQDTSAFTGTGLQMNFGNTTGSFSSSSSKYIDFQNAGVSVFTVSAYGTTTIGDGTTNNMAGLQIGYGGICVDNDGSCTASTTGTISYVSSFSGNSDLAENYFSGQDLETGELVTLSGGLSVARAEKGATLPVLGVVSTKPGITMGSDDTSLRVGETAYPIALAGRVPVKLSTENGPIKKGDQLMLSSLPGIAMKATGTGATVGIALEDFTDSRMYSDTYLNQFGDDMVDPIYEPVVSNADTRINDGCYYGGGNAAEEGSCVPLVATTSSGQISEVNNRLAEASVAQQIQELKQVRSATKILATGEAVKVGQVVMFVQNGHRWVDESQLASVASLFSTSSLVTVGENESETVFDRLVALANSFVDGVFSIFELRADRVEVAQELCIDGICVTADDLRTMLEYSNAEGQVIEVEEVSPEEEESEPEEEQSPEPTSGETTSTSTDPVASTTPETADLREGSGDQSSSTDSVASSTLESTTDTESTDSEEGLDSESSGSDSGEPEEEVEPETEVEETEVEEEVQESESPEESQEEVEEPVV